LATGTWLTADRSSLAVARPLKSDLHGAVFQASRRAKALAKADRL